MELHRKQVQSSHGNTAAAQNATKILSHQWLR